MRLIMIEVLIMNLGGFLFNPHDVHTRLHDVIKSHSGPEYGPPKFIMSTSIIMSLLVFQWVKIDISTAKTMVVREAAATTQHVQRQAYIPQPLKSLYPYTFEPREATSSRRAIAPRAGSAIIAPWPHCYIRL